MTVANEKSERPIEEIRAGWDFRDTMIPRADQHAGHAPLWHGWVIMDAFLAGIDWARAQEQAKQTDQVTER